MSFPLLSSHVLDSLSGFLCARSMHRLSLLRFAMKVGKIDQHYFLFPAYLANQQLVIVNGVMQGFYIMTTRL
jgi:hypothetical protein